MNTSQILPDFSEAVVLDEAFLKSDELYSSIYEYQKREKFCWLIDEKNLLWEFIETLGEKISPFNFYDFHAAYNITFPSETVRLLNDICIVNYDLHDMSELLSALLVTKEKFLPHAVFLKRGQVPEHELIELKRKIIQQFIYLRAYLPVIIADDYASADLKFRKILHAERNKPFRLAVTGTKKAGKSTFINAMFGKQYSPASPELPTPCSIMYSEDRNAGDRIILAYEDQIKIFIKPEELNKFLRKKFLEARKNSSALGNMHIIIPKFPEELRGFKIYDTPGSNFAGVQGHREAALSSIKKCDACLFVMNYSLHLMDDELEIFDNVCEIFDHVIIALNRIDEMYSTEVVKSYERATDYIASKLEALGRKKFLIVPISALASSYSQSAEEILSSGRNDLLDKLLRAPNNEHITSSLKALVKNFDEFYGIKINSLEELEDIGRVKYLMHIINQLNK